MRDAMVHIPTRPVCHVRRPVPSKSGIHFSTISRRAVLSFYVTWNIRIWIETRLEYL